jgi:hypothetical protein
LPLSEALGTLVKTINDNGNTEVSFILAFFLWIMVAGAGWIVYKTYITWESGALIEFSSRNLRIFNGLSNDIKLFITVVLLSLIAYFAIKQTCKFINMARK